MTEQDLAAVRFGAGHAVLESIESMFNDREQLLLADDTAVNMTAFREGWCRVLMFAVLDYWFERPATQKFKSARDWIFYSGDAAPNSFGNVASFLDLCPKALRRAITTRRSEFAVDPRRARAALNLVRGQGNGTRLGLPIDGDYEGGDDETGF
jgi:hypothetical protein